MTIAEFEEKEFEGALNTQLTLGGPMWSPGQVLEQLVGFMLATREPNRERIAESTRALDRLPR